jgi:hypothetical protein
MRFDNVAPFTLHGTLTPYLNFLTHELFFGQRKEWFVWSLIASRTSAS